MYKQKKVGIVIPAYNEENLLPRVIETLPEFVDRIIIVDDHSTDKTGRIIEEYQKHDVFKHKIVSIRHEKNQGVGGAIATGYKYALKEQIDVTVVMAGDAQMDPADLEKIIDPVVTGQVDYAKGNRLFTGEAWDIIPKHRYLGNAFLSLLTKIASGYWHLADSQSGYTAISLHALKSINIDRIYKRYGMPNDLLVKLNLQDIKVKDIPITPVYNIGEKSGIKIGRIVFSLSFLLFKLFWWRLFHKYVIKDFHPLIFFYLMSFTLLPSGILLGIIIIAVKGYISITWLILSAILIISGMQSLFFAMWFDMDYNKELI